MFAAKRILNYTVKQQLIDILPATLFSAVMAACVKCVTQLLNGAFVSLAAGIATGVAVYLLLCMLFHVPEIKQLKISYSNVSMLKAMMVESGEQTSCFIAAATKYGR